MAQQLGGSNNARLAAFKVARHAPELILPAGPTPYEFKELSDIDDQGSIRIQVPVVQFYRDDGSSRDPAPVIKEAVAKALVPYYPLAGRLREKQGGKLVVECSGEGVLFIEADADVTLADFGQPLQPPFPCFDQLLYDVPDSATIMGSPVLLLQVTRLKCGGFILAIRVNHTIVDGQGLQQFMNAVAELARGFDSLTIQPVWERHLLFARQPPQVTYVPGEYEVNEDIVDIKATIIPFDNMVHKSFFFGHKEIAALRRFIPPHVKASTFEILTSCLWRCRTISLRPDPEEIVRIVYAVNARTLFDPPLPKGFYGNAWALAVACSTAFKLFSNPIGYALELVKKAKASITQEYMKSLADYTVLKGRPQSMLFEHLMTFMISDLVQCKFDDLDFGWGLPTYAGAPKDGVDAIKDLVSFYASSKNENGEKRILVPMCLPDNAMKIFIKELNGLLSDVPPFPIANTGPKVLMSSSL